MANQIIDGGGGEVIGDWAFLESLAGVGHKTASVVMGGCFGVPAFAVDTHIHRLAGRWGLSNGSTVERTEKDLKAVFPEDTWSDRHLQIIYFGREYCPARRHDLSTCPICGWAATKKRIASRDGRLSRASRRSGRNRIARSVAFAAVSRRIEHWPLTMPMVFVGAGIAHGGDRGGRPHAGHRRQSV